MDHEDEDHDRLAIRAMLDGPAARRGLRFHAVAAMVAIVLAVAEVGPVVLHLSTHFPASRPETTEAIHDQLLTAWILASDVRRLEEDPLHVFDTNNMHPFRNTLAFSENLLGMAIVVWPVQALWNDPVLTNNVALIFTIALSAYGVVLLVHELTGSLASAFVAALLAVFAPWVWANIAQIHVAAGQATPLALFALARLVRTGEWRFALLLGVLAAWQAWASLHWGLFLALGLVAAAPVLLLTSRAAWRALPRLAAAGLLAGLLVVPLALPYLAVAREMGMTDRGYVLGLYLPWKVLPAFTDPVGYFAARVSTGVRNSQRLTLTPWVLMGLGLVAGALVRRRPGVWKSMIAAIVAGGVVNFWYALGPVDWYGIPSLYGMLSRIPGLAVVRSAARGTAYVSLVTAVLGGCALAVLLARVPSRVGRGVLVAVVAGLGIAEGGWRPGGLAAAPARRVRVPAPFARLPADCAVAELPTSFRRQALALFESTAHWRPVVNGRSGFYPIPVNLEIGLLNRFPRPPSIEYLRDAGACAVVLHADEPIGAWMLEVSRRDGLVPRLIAPFQWLVRLPPEPPVAPEAPIVDRTGWRVLEPEDCRKWLVDDSLETACEIDATAGNVPARITIDLGEVTELLGVDLRLGRRFRRFLWTYRVEGSSDGESWRTIGERQTAVPPLASYRADPDRIVQRIRFPETELRFLRVGPYRKPVRGLFLDGAFSTWAVAEVDVRGRPAE